MRLTEYDELQETDGGEQEPEKDQTRPDGKTQSETELSGNGQKAGSVQKTLRTKDLAKTEATCRQYIHTGE